MDELLILLLLLPALLGAIWTLRRYHQRRAQFQRRAKDQGLRPAQRRLLWQLAHQQRRNAVLLLRSATAFELCVGEYVRSGGKGAVLAALARIRVLLSFDQSPSGQPLRSTRQLVQGQTLNLWPEGGGYQPGDPMPGGLRQRGGPGPHPPGRHHPDLASGDRPARLFRAGAAHPVPLHHPTPGPHPAQPQPATRRADPTFADAGVPALGHRLSLDPDDPGPSRPTTNRGWPGRQHRWRRAAGCGCRCRRRYLLAPR